MRAGSGGGFLAWRSSCWAGGSLPGAAWPFGASWWHHLSAAVQRRGLWRVHATFHLAPLPAPVSTSAAATLATLSGLPPWQCFNHTLSKIKDDPRITVRLGEKSACKILHFWKDIRMRFHPPLVPRVPSALPGQLLPPRPWPLWRCGPATFPAAG